MKASNKIIIGVLVFILLYMIIGLFVLRINVSSLPEDPRKIVYKEMAMGEFKNLEFSSDWDVRIFQGGKQKVEIEESGEPKKGINIEVINNTLYFKIDSTIYLKSKKLHVKIITPVLNSLKATGNTQINLMNFDADSINIQLKDGVRFIGRNNKLRNVSFITTGNTTTQLTDTENF